MFAIKRQYNETKHVILRGVRTIVGFHFEKKQIGSDKYFCSALLCEYHVTIYCDVTILYLQKPNGGFLWGQCLLDDKLDMLEYWKAHHFFSITAEIKVNYSKLTCKTNTNKTTKTDFFKCPIFLNTSKEKLTYLLFNLCQRKLFLCYVRTVAKSWCIPKT